MDGTSTALATRPRAVEFIKVVKQEDLVQYGRLGMKWGRRRTRAELAAEPVGKADDKPDAAAPAKVAIGPGAKPKSIKDMDTKELQEAVNRLNLEKQLRQLTAKPKKKTAKDFIKDAVKDIVVDVAKTEVSRVAKGAGRLQIEKTLAKSGTVTAKEVAEYLEKQRKKK